MNVLAHGNGPDSRWETARVAEYLKSYVDANANNSQSRYVVL